MNEIFLKKSDILPSLQVTASGANSALDFTNATGVNFAYRTRYTGVATVATGGFISKSAGTLQFDFTTGLTANVGPYFGEFRILFSGGAQQSWPNDGYINFTITSGLI